MFWIYRQFDWFCKTSITFEPMVQSYNLFVFGMSESSAIHSEAVGPGPARVPRTRSDRIIRSDHPIGWLGEAKQEPGKRFLSPC